MLTCLLVYLSCGQGRIRTTEGVCQLISSHYGFRRQHVLFVGWTLSSSGLDASR